MRPADAVEAALVVMGAPQKKEAILHPESRPRIIREIAPDMPADQVEEAGELLYERLMVEMDRKMTLGSPHLVETTERQGSPKGEKPKDGKDASQDGGSTNTSDPQDAGGSPKQSESRRRTVESASEFGMRLPKPPQS